MKRNICPMLKTLNHPHVRYHQYGNFDVLDSLDSQSKHQLYNNLKKYFENKHEPQLPRITGNIGIIKDK